MSAILIELETRRQRRGTGSRPNTAPAPVAGADHEILMRENLMGLAVVLGLVLSGITVLNTVRGLDAALRCADLGVMECGPMAR